VAAAAQRASQQRQLGAADLALALWSAGRKDEAVQWYGAAIRTEPQLWRDPANFTRLLPDWRDSEHATLAEVQAAWAANPPQWP
jgi:hypothetical protein